MSVTISGSQYTVKGTVKNIENNEGIMDLHVLAYDKDVLGKDLLGIDDFLGIGVTDATGTFSISFDSSKFKGLFDRKPDLYFIVKDAGLELLNTINNVIKNADTTTPAINLLVDISNDKLRQDINTVPVDGWVGGFECSNSDFAYPNPDLSSLPMLGNLENIPELKRQQKVVWPEFSWLSEPGEADPKRCYQMFAPDISRLGYTNEGRVYSIICPQQGFCSPHLENINVEVTVTGNRGWANEKNRELAADMMVEGRIWFSPGVEENEFLKHVLEHFNKNNLPFPNKKENAIVVKTFKPGNPDQPIFPLRKGPSTDFPIPDFAKHPGVSWTLGHLGVEIGSIVKTGIEKVDVFNQIVLDTFNAVSGNMLKEGNTLTWNVWFTAPELVDTVEWAEHAEKWRKSIDTDHGSPDGPGTDPRYFDGTPYQPLKEILKHELPKIVAYLAKHI